MVDTTKRGLGKNYFKYCIRPDQHSIEILREFKDLLAGKVDFFSTIYWQEKDERTDWFLIAASPPSGASVAEAIRPAKLIVVTQLAAMRPPRAP